MDKLAISMEHESFYFSLATQVIFGWTQNNAYKKFLGNLYSVLKLKIIKGLLV